MSKKSKPSKKGKARHPMNGVFTEYLEAGFGFAQLIQERRKQLTRISDVRKRDVLVYAADAKKHRRNADASIAYEDLPYIHDQLTPLSRRGVDVILETTGGLGEVAEDIVNLLRAKFKSVAFIIPGQAKSAGTMMVMSGNEILMEPVSSLGPIDAQISLQGTIRSAHAVLEGFNKIKETVTQTGVLNRAYIPVLQGISPGDLQACRNAQMFSQKLVSSWLERYKFATWRKHSSTGVAVTDEDRHARAEEIARHLCDHGQWLTHNRSIKLHDLVKMGLKVIDYSRRPVLHDAILRYRTLLQMTFDQTAIFKVFETQRTQLLRQVVDVQGPVAVGPTPTEGICELDIDCASCKHKMKVQANLNTPSPIKQGFVGFPKDNQLTCPKCGVTGDVSALRRNVEGQSRMPIV